MKTPVTTTVAAPYSQETAVYSPTTGAQTGRTATMPMLRIIKYVLYDILRSKIVIAYTLFLAAVSFGLFSLSDDPSKGLISLLNIALIVVPLVSVVFSTIHFYNSYEFIELLAAQPIRRSTILWAEFAGVALALSAALLVGIGLPMLLFAPTATGFTLLGVSVAQTLVFIAIAFLASVKTRDKAKGIGVALMLWFYFSLLYDAFVLMLMFSFADYPLEKAMIAMVSLNPVDLGRVMVLLQMDISALMGYTGALFREFFGTAMGISFVSIVMLLWMAVPLFWAVKVFKEKDL